MIAIESSIVLALAALMDLSSQKDKFDDEKWKEPWNASTLNLVNAFCVYTNNVIPAYIDKASSDSLTAALLIQIQSLSRYARAIDVLPIPLNSQNVKELLKKLEQWVDHLLPLEPDAVLVKRVGASDQNEAEISPPQLDAEDDASSPASPVNLVPESVVEPLPEVPKSVPSFTPVASKDYVVKECGDGVKPREEEDAKLKEKEPVKNEPAADGFGSGFGSGFRSNQTEQTFGSKTEAVFGSGRTEDGFGSGRNGGGFPGGRNDRIGNKDGQERRDSRNNEGGYGGGRGGFGRGHEFGGGRDYQERRDGGNSFYPGRGGGQGFGNRGEGGQRNYGSRGEGFTSSRGQGNRGGSNQGGFGSGRGGGFGSGFGGNSGGRGGASLGSNRGRHFSTPSEAEN